MFLIDETVGLELALIISSLEEIFSYHLNLSRYVKFVTFKSLAILNNGGS